MDENVDDLFDMDVDNEEEMEADNDEEKESESAVGDADDDVNGEPDDDDEDADADADADDDEEDEEDEDAEGDADAEAEDDADADAEAEAEAEAEIETETEQIAQTRSAPQTSTAATAAPSRSRSQSPGVPPIRSAQPRKVQLVPGAATCRGYDITPYVAAPHNSAIYSLATSRGMKWVFTGDSDGFIRRFDFFDSINGKVPLTVAQKHPFADSVVNAGVLLSYWENEVPQVKSEIKIVDGEYYEPKVSPVYSLAVHSEALWLLAGQSNGGIALQSVRHMEGQTHHYFKQHTSAVSVLKLADDELSFLSGSWDQFIIDWDLNTGSAVRKFPKASGQISCLEYQPLGGAAVVFAESGANGVVGRRSLNGNSDAGAEGAEGAAEAEADDDMDSLFGSDEGETKPAAGETEAGEGGEGGIGETGTEAEAETETGTGVTKSETEPQNSIPDSTNPNPNSAVGSSINSTNATTDNSSPAPPAPPVYSTNAAEPQTGLTDPHVFLSASIDGTLALWDKREGKRVARIPVALGKTPPWCMSACWSPDGNRIYAGRRNNSVDEYDIRMAPWPRQTLRFPAASGPVSSVATLPNNRHILCGSYDNVRLYDLHKSPLASDAGSRKRKSGSGNPVPFLIVPGHHGGILSSIYVDPSCQFLLTASGGRGWQDSTTETLLMYEISVIE